VFGTQKIGKKFGRLISTLYIRTVKTAIFKQNEQFVWSILLLLLLC